MTASCPHVDIYLIVMLQLAVAAGGCGPAMRSGL